MERQTNGVSERAEKEAGGGRVREIFLLSAFTQEAGGLADALRDVPERCQSVGVAGRKSSISKCGHRPSVSWKVESAHSS